MTTPVLELETLDDKLKAAIEAAENEPIVITEQGRPAYVLRSVTDDDLVDELLVTSPAFLASIRRARQQKASGRVKTLQEVKAEYTVGEAEDD